MKFNIETTKMEGELFNIFKDNTQEEQNFLLQKVLSDDKKYFNGLVNDDSFRIKRTIMYNNSFLPIIEGRIVDNGNFACCCKL